MKKFSEIDTPALIVDGKKLGKNIGKAKAACARLGVHWRPHLKTHKCVEIARMQMESAAGPATVSTVKEAEEFVAAGVKDLIYAVGIAPHKLVRLQALNEAGADVKIILDNVASAKTVSDYTVAHHCRFGVLIEIDCDGHRSGLKPENKDAILAVAASLTGGADLVGVLTHAGGSYNVYTDEGMVQASQVEAKTIAEVADLLRQNGYDIRIVSAGSTPTLGAVQEARGVTEYRSGVGTFFDLVMAGIHACAVEEIAVSVLVTVIGHQVEKGWVITDGGWMAMSRDRGTAAQSKDWGFGAVCDETGKILPEYYVSGANQEHGIVSRFDGKPISTEEFPVGRQLRILPNHACPCAAAFDKYYVTDDNVTVSKVWQRFNHW